MTSSKTPRQREHKSSKSVELFLHIGVIQVSVKPRVSPIQNMPVALSPAKATTAISANIITPPAPDCFAGCMYTGVTCGAFTVGGLTLAAGGLALAAGGFTLGFLGATVFFPLPQLLQITSFS